MFDQLVGVAKDIRGEILELYWLLLAPVVLILVVLEFFKAQRDGIDVFDILKRVVVSILLLLSFEYTINIIGELGDGIVGKIDKTTDVWEVLKNLGPNYNDASSGLFDLQGHIIYTLALLSYLVAYLGFFVTEALINFVWVVLYTLSPLMILAYVAKSTANVTVNLYKGLVKVVVWKLLWTVLSVLLLKLAMEHQASDMEDYILAIIMNLCIGLSMLFIPLATRSLINDGLETAASGLALAPATAAVSAAKVYAKQAARQGMARTWDAGKVMARPVMNHISRGLGRFK
ncbi:MAG: hypothetical protein OYH77_08975 [Pseudomonadota bacterium]|nr:hypothetical protein [Pseudomonadota bacterium]